MRAFDLKKPPVVRLPPKSNVEIILSRCSQVSMIACGVMVGIVALYFGRFLLAPVTLAIVIGLMLGPVAARLENAGLPSWASAALVFLLFIFIWLALMVALVGPLSFWWGELPRIWEQLREQAAELRAPMESLRGLQEQLTDLTGGSGVTVSVEDGSAFQSLATLAPAVLAQMLLFMASLYFFVATRHQIRTAVLKMCIGRRLRWRIAHIFREVEASVSRYLLSIAAINLGLAVAVTAVLWLYGVPSPALLGALAGLLNFIMYVGPAIMTAILFAVGLASYDTITASLLVPIIYLSVNMIEANVVTPMVIGRTMTLNPFLVLLAVGFWIWVWGPIGGFVAIPVLLIIFSIGRNILPADDRPHLP
jgi:predicted PurR-regulated permease PerM